MPELRAGFDLLFPRTRPRPSAQSRDGPAEGGRNNVGRRDMGFLSSYRPGVAPRTLLEMAGAGRLISLAAPRRYEAYDDGLRK